MRRSVTIPLLLASVSGSCLAENCRLLEIPVTVTSTNLVWGPAKFENDFQLTDLVDKLTSRTPPPPSEIFNGTKDVTASYEIAATYCTPGRGDSNKHKDTLLIASHGLGYDGSYWDPEIQPERYSFVRHATARGYSVLYYDRLGVGKSTRVSGYEAQASTQTAILQELTNQLKAGKHIKSKPKSVVLVGHSYGSALSLGAATADPKIADALVITGLSLNSTYQNTKGFLQVTQPRIASKQRPQQWGKLDTGYITGVDLYANILGFFKYPYFDPKVAQWADDHKAPISISELLSSSGQEGVPTEFKGPTLFITGKYDFIFCQSNCDDGVLETPADQIFSNFKSISYPESAHGLNLHKNAPGAFKEIIDFLESNGF
ncbi:uncharacterized protein DNG_03111 [Cephalotrichum gorgonifer]|uniref:AB hydrolase-1 domain-containing protein n=1 Tax=Cephalotrichum gorgonifer TaxID=2041049 RepID=A0AAE8MTL9_9PEZI|nr:uncharacterized protein DNG_03111 [Cephalotrichum gorgonifer]